MSEIEFTGRASDFLKIGVAAAGRGDVELVRAILKARPKWIHHIGSHGRTMLWEASHRGKLAMVKYLVRRKANIHACGGHYTPYFVEVNCLTIARHKGHDEVAEFLIAKGATLGIHGAAFLGELADVKSYLKQDSKLLHQGHVQHEMAEKNDPHLETVPTASPWATPLCYALRGGHVDVVQYLIRRKSKIKGFEKQLFIAANEQPELVRLLLENGADPTQAPTANPDDKELYEVLTSFGVAATSSLENSKELVYLCRGDRGGNPDEVARLIRCGADVNHQDHKGKTAAHRAAKAGFENAIRVLIDAGADVHLKDERGETVLFELARSTIKNTKALNACARLLLSAGADPSLPNPSGKTAHLLCKRPSLRRLLMSPR